jgi:hypothetical protein
MNINPKYHDKLLGVAAIIALIIVIGNAIEYFLANENYLQVDEGKVSKVIHETYGNRTLYASTEIELENNKSNFSLTDKADDGGYIEVTEGETIKIYSQQWFQLFFNFQSPGKIYYVERNGERVYNNLGEWKGRAFYYMLVAGGCAIALTLMYFDQAKNVSIANWYQKKIGKKKGTIT